MSPLPTKSPSLPELTSHAMLVPWGMFAQQIGLVKALMRVPISQKMREHLPQTKRAGVPGRYLEWLRLSPGHQPECSSPGPRPIRGSGLGAEEMGRLQWREPYHASQ